MALNERNLVLVVRVSSLQIERLRFHIEFLARQSGRRSALVRFGARGAAALSLFLLNARGHDCYGGRIGRRGRCYDYVLVVHVVFVGNAHCFGVVLALLVVALDHDQVRAVRLDATRLVARLVGVVADASGRLKSN